MKTTIKAKVGYRVRRIVFQDPNSENVMLFKNPCVLRDGDDLVMMAEMRSTADYDREVVCGENEAAHFCECFITVRGNKFIYWRDEETDEDFLTKVISE